MSDNFDNRRIMSVSNTENQELVILDQEQSLDLGDTFHNSTKLASANLKQIIENYLSYYACGEGHTARAKRYDLKHFIEFLARKKDRDIDQVLVSDWTLQTSKDFIDQRLNLGEAPATVSRRLATIKHFGRTLAERIPDFINPAREVKSPVLQNSKPQGLTEYEIDLLRQAAQKEVAQKPDSFAALRNQILIELLLATGLRADEIRVLCLGQISSDFNWLKNVKTKGRKFRKVYLDSTIRESLINYLNARDRELYSRFPKYRALNKQELAKFPVLCGHYRAFVAKPESFGLAPKSIWRIVSELGKKAQGLSEKNITNLHPHLLRHTFAHGLLDSSKDVRLVAQALGHSDVRVTMRYTERTENELAQAIEAKQKFDR